MRRFPTVAALAALCVVFSAQQASPPALAQSYGPKGQGAIVIAAEAHVYKKKAGEAIAYRLKRGDAVAGYTGGALVPPTWMFVEDDGGRARVVYFQVGKSIDSAGWMRVTDLAVFTYDGSCVGPKATTGALRVGWNPCFQEARDAKLEELRAAWTKEDQKSRAP